MRTNLPQPPCPIGAQGTKSTRLRELISTSTLKSRRSHTLVAHAPTPLTRAQAPMLSTHRSLTPAPSNLIWGERRLQLARQASEVMFTLMASVFWFSKWAPFRKKSREQPSCVVMRSLNKPILDIIGSSFANHTFFFGLSQTSLSVWASLTPSSVSRLTRVIFPSLKSQAGPPKA